MKKIIKNIFAFLFIAVLGITLAACKGKEKPAPTPKALIPQGGPVLSLAMLKDEIDISTANGPALIAPELYKESYDFIILDAVTGVKMFNKNPAGFKYKAVASLSKNNMYVLSKTAITDANSLQDKKLFGFGEKGTPGALIKSIFKELIDANKINIDWVAGIKDIIPTALKDDTDAVLVAYPVALAIKGALAKKGVTTYIKSLLEFTNSPKAIPMSTLYAKKTLSQELINTFSTKIKENIKNLLEDSSNHIDKIATFTEEFPQLESQKELFKKTISKMSMVFEPYSAAATKTELIEFITYLNKIDQAIVGNKLPEDSFFN